MKTPEPKAVDTWRRAPAMQDPDDVGLPKEQGLIIAFAPRKGRSEVAPVVEFKNARAAQTA